jgi:hypothetical protein
MAEASYAKSAEARPAPRPDPLADDADGPM